MVASIVIYRKNNMIPHRSSVFDLAMLQTKFFNMQNSLQKWSFQYILDILGKGGVFFFGLHSLRANDDMILQAPLTQEQNYYLLFLDNKIADFVHPTWSHICSTETLQRSVFYFIQLFLHSPKLHAHPVAEVLSFSWIQKWHQSPRQSGEEKNWRSVSIWAVDPFRSRQMILRSVWASIKCPVQSRVLCLGGQPLLLPFAKWAPLNVQLDSAIPHRKVLEQRQHGGEEGHDGFILFLPATHTAHTSITGPAGSTSRQHLGCDLSQVLRRWHASEKHG